MNCHYCEDIKKNKIFLNEKETSLTIPAIIILSILTDKNHKTDVVLYVQYHYMFNIIICSIAKK